MKRNNAKGKAAPSLIWETGTLKFDLVFFNVQYLYHFFLATNKTHLSSVYFEKSHVFNFEMQCSCITHATVNALEWLFQA